MDAFELGRAALAIAIGFVLGSVLPADILGRARGVDIRSVGDGNPGTVNAVRELGWAPGLITAVYDLSVGVIALLIAETLGLRGGPAYLAGLAAVAGHRLPLFNRFRGGGQGMAASAGLLVYGIGIGMSRGWITVTDLALLAAVLIGVFAFTRSDSAGAVVMLPMFAARVALSGGELAWVLFEVALAAHIWVVQLGRARAWLQERRLRTQQGHPRS